MASIRYQPDQPKRQQSITDQEFKKRIEFLKDFYEEDDVSDDVLENLVLEFQDYARNDFKNYIIENYSEFI